MVHDLVGLNSPAVSRWFSEATAFSAMLGASDGLARHIDPGQFDYAAEDAILSHMI